MSFFPPPSLWCLLLPDDVPTFKLGRLGQAVTTWGGGARGLCKRCVVLAMFAARQIKGLRTRRRRLACRSVIDCDCGRDAVRYCLVCAALGVLSRRDWPRAGRTKDDGESKPWTGYVTTPGIFVYSLVS